MKRNFFWIGALILFLTSCVNKEDDDIINNTVSYPYTLSFDRLVMKELTVVTQEGIVTDSATAQEYLNQYASSSPISGFDEMIGPRLPIPDSTWTYTVLSADEVEYTVTQGMMLDSTIVCKRIIKSENQMEYWELSDTVWVQGISPVIQIGPPLVIGLPHPNKPTEIKTKYEPLYMESFQLPNTSGMAPYIQMRPCVFVEYDGDQLYIPFIRFFVRYFCIDVQNVIDMESLLSLKENEIVIYQEYRYYLKK